MDLCMIRTSLFCPRLCRSFRISGRRSISPCLVSITSFRPRFNGIPWHKRGLFLCQDSPMTGVVETMEIERGLQSTKIPSSLREKVEKAVERQGYRVTVGDVSGAAGVTLSEAEDALQALAADSLGSLEVSNEGEVVYVFASDFRNVIRSKSFWIRMEPTMKRTKETLATIGRIAFGVLFVTTVIAVWVAILFSSSDDKDRDRKDSSRGGMFINVFDIARIFSYSNYYDSPPRDPEELSFIESVFSFMFGDGDPNKDLEDYRWNIIGRYIKSRGGVVVAEELAPYLDLPPDALENEDSFVVDEGYMLPVLTRFEGEPIVSDDGKLIYIFPKFQTTGIERFIGGLNRTNVGYLEEEKWKFSKATAGKLFLVLAFAIANVVGVGILSSRVPEFIASGAASPPLVYAGMTGLQLYAASFLVIPVIRWFMNLSKNKSIESRNELRKQSFDRLMRLPNEVRSKLEVARRLAKRKLVREEDVVYSSSKDIASQSSQWEGETFDKQLDERNPN
eukprot:g1774.t1